GVFRLEGDALKKVVAPPQNPSFEKTRFAVASPQSMLAVRFGALFELQAGGWNELAAPKGADLVTAGFDGTGRVWVLSKAALYQYAQGKLEKAHGCSLAVDMYVANDAAYV